MFIQFMHFSSLEVLFSSISKIFIHPENGGTSSEGRAPRGGTGSGRCESGRVGSSRGRADWPGPRRAAQPNPPLPTSTLFHFLLVCGALLRCASLRSALCCSHSLSVAHNPRSALESVPQGSAPILFHFFPPIFPPFYSHPFRSGSPSLLSLLCTLRFCMRLCIQGHFLFVLVLLCFSTSMQRRC